MIFSRIRDSLSAHLNLGSHMRRLTDVERELSYLTLRFGTGASDNKIDTATPRLPILNKIGEGPLIAPSGVSWMSGAVYDGRPILFGDRRFIYFCAQTSYRSDGAMFVGVAEWVNEKIVVDPVPILFPDIEKRGVDIPAFTVWRGEIVGIYLDDYGRDRSGQGYDTPLMIVRSGDGRKFEKSSCKHPFGKEWRRIGLPWLLADGDRLWVYWRGKVGGDIRLVRTELSESLESFVGDVASVSLPRNAVNVAVTNRSGLFLLFYGGSRAGGLYVVPSSDGIAWDFSKEMMLVGNNGHEWGWDYFKICGSPDNTTNDNVELCYLGENATSMAIGAANFNMQELRAAWD
jgi:hypothetical protein